MLIPGDLPLAKGTTRRKSGIRSPWQPLPRLATHPGIHVLQRSGDGLRPPPVHWSPSHDPLANQSKPIISRLLRHFCIGTLQHHKINQSPASAASKPIRMAIEV